MPQNDMFMTTNAKERHKMDIYSIKLSDECLSNISNSFFNISLIGIFSTHSNLFKWHQHLGHFNIDM
jgi:hypothetical protein